MYWRILLDTIIIMVSDIVGIQRQLWLKEKNDYCIKDTAIPDYETQ